jgi:hypothetical protein
MLLLLEEREMMQEGEITTKGETVITWAEIVRLFVITAKKLGIQSVTVRSYRIATKELRLLLLLLSSLLVLVLRRQSQSQQMNMPNFPSIVKWRKTPH